MRFRDDGCERGKGNSQNPDSIRRLEGIKTSARTAPGSKRHYSFVPTQAGFEMSNSGQALCSAPKVAETWTAPSAPPSAHEERLGTVDKDVGAGDMRGVIGGEEGNEIRDLFGFSRLATGEWDPPVGIFYRFLFPGEVSLGGVLGDVGVDRSGADAVHTDTVFCKFEGDHFHESDNASL